MRTSKNMKKTEETLENQCEFCKKVFKRESSIVNHTCEGKRRWLDKDLQSNRIGFQTWLVFYDKNTMAKKPRTYSDFIKSPYYLAFVKFGAYCVNAHVFNPIRYSEWLITNKVSVDSWTTDTNYNKFLIDFLKFEDPFDAIYRSVETTVQLSEIENVKSSDVLKYGNTNRICQYITNAKISPWMLYQSDSGKFFLERLNETQIKLIFDYINPEAWAIKFVKYPEQTKTIKELLKVGGY